MIATDKKKRQHGAKQPDKIVQFKINLGIFRKIK